ncbi:MAG: 3-deoxy-D-manno-octulosonic acid transferase [Planctomycetota bacterium]
MASGSKSSPAVEPIRDDPNSGLLAKSLHGFYDLAWYAVVLLGSPWLALKGLRDRGFRAMVLERLGMGLPRLSADAPARVLIHGVSVGETKGAQSLVQRLRESAPGVEIVFSTSTSTGQEVARQLYPDLEVVRFPVDPAPVVSRFLSRLRPTAIVLVELEIWPNFLRAANRRGIPVAVVNGRITDRSYGRYELFRSLFPQFNRISMFCAQSDVYAERFRSLGVEEERIVVTGNVKVDGLEVGRAEPGSELKRLLGADDERPVIVAGSTHDPEERMLLEACARAVPEARLILVPRHPDRAPSIVEQCAAHGLTLHRLTELRDGLVEPDPSVPALVDTIGELEAVYGLADIAFVGGSLIPHGGQNVLEPAAQGLPVVFGPHVENFYQEVALLEQSDACRRVEDARELEGVLLELCGDADLRARYGAAAQAVVAAQRGATDLTWAALERLL